MSDILFQRSNSGLNNQHLFYGVDYVAYTEGGDSLSFEKVLNGEFNDSSIDKLFWEFIVKNYSNKSFKFKPIGSKSTLKLLLDKFMRDNISHNLICTDSEFDEVFNDKIDSDKIIYTYGYSWENDVWNENLLVFLINQLTGIDNNKEEIFNDFNMFLNHIDCHVKYDAHFFKTDSKYFPRPNGHQKLINCDSNSYPNVMREQLQKIIDDLQIDEKLEEQILTNYSALNVKKYCYGHLFNDFCKNYIKYYLRVKHKLTGIADDIIRRLAISNFLTFLPANVTRYYSTTLSVL
ncbi:hypothetical protein [Flavobacterium sp.]|uniref:hypothetical protein n=1 Tax=Flavobacterium sp. TaxID=239 RepID=UPI0035B1BE84